MMSQKPVNLNHSFSDTFSDLAGRVVLGQIFQMVVTSDTHINARFFCISILRKKAKSGCMSRCLIGFKFCEGSQA